MNRHEITSGSKKLQGQIAFVTGASSGLGYRFAQTLADAGAQVVVAARRAERLEELVDTIRKSGGAASFLEMDVSHADTIPTAIDAAESAFDGKVSILVNNAGCADAGKAIRQSVAGLDRMWEVNVRAPYLLSTEVARRLIDAKLPGRIVNISSIGAYSYDGKIPCAMYVATKSAVARMTEALSLEWASSSINVNAIAPGFFRSEMSAPTLESMGEDWLASRQTRKRICEPYQLDSTLLYLVSPESECVTGTCIKVDDAQMPR
ncbi:MAG: SDR family NAD(P)-dependent oxidoreductase [Sphingomonadaceae bacterium]